MKHQLDFEKPIVELQTKLEELKRHPETHSLGISFEEEVALIEKKLEANATEISLNETPSDIHNHTLYYNLHIEFHHRPSFVTECRDVGGVLLFDEKREVVVGAARNGHQNKKIIGNKKGPDPKEN